MLEALAQPIVSRLLLFSDASAQPLPAHDVLSPDALPPLEPSALLLLA